MAQADFLILIDGKIQDTAQKLSQDRRLEALGAALDEYSTLSPRPKFTILTGDGTTTSFPMPSTFEPGFSVVTSVEYPVGQVEPTYLSTEDEEYTLYADPVTQSVLFRFVGFTLPAGKQAYVTSTARHFVASQSPAGETTADTVPLRDRDAVANLAASHCAMMLAAYYAQTSEPTIVADAVNYGTRTDRYIALAKALRETYNAAFGITDGVMAASGHLDLDNLPQVGWDRFFHSRFTR